MIPKSIVIQSIVRLTDVGFSITPFKFSRKAEKFQFGVENGIKLEINEIKGTSGRAWLRGFLQRHPNISKRKVQHLKEARSQKFNRVIVRRLFL